MDNSTAEIFRCNGYFNGVFRTWSPETVCRWATNTGCTLPKTFTAHGWTRSEVWRSHAEKADLRNEIFNNLWNKVGTWLDHQQITIGMDLGTNFFVRECHIRKNQLLNVMDSNCGHIDSLQNTKILQTTSLYCRRTRGSNVCWFGTHNREDYDEHLWLGIHTIATFCLVATSWTLDVAALATDLVQDMGTQMYLL